jgi:hypothetical protein
LSTLPGCACVKKDRLRPEGKREIAVFCSKQQNPEGLTARGWQRVGAIAYLFSPLAAADRNAGLLRPQAIYATAAAAHHNRSLRPQHTVGPLAARLGTTTNVAFAVGREADLVTAAKASPGAVLIAWHREAIPAIANAIIGNGTTCPQHWPGERFDVIWVFDLEPGQSSWRFSQVPQLLLAGDTDNPIA